MQNNPTISPKQKLFRLITNTVSLITNDMVNRAITFVVYALIARYLGPYEFGQMSLTLTIFYLLQSLAPVGLKILLVRDVAKDKSRSGEYLVNGSIVALVTSVAALVLMGIFLVIMNYSRDTVMIIIIISMGLIPYSITAVSEAILQSHEQIRFITMANVPISILRGVAAFVLLANGFSLVWVGLLFIVSYTATMIFEWYLISKNVTRPVWKIDSELLRKISKSSITFLGLQTVIAVTGSILPLFLSKSAGEIEVGLLNAANQLMAPVLMVGQSTVMSLFPRMVFKFETGANGFRQISERLLEILLTFTLPLTVLLFFFAEPALLLLYGKIEFAESTMVLQIMVWILISRGITAILGRLLMASQRERTLLNILIFEAALTLVLSFVFIPSGKSIGAAYVSLIIGAVDLVLHIIYTWNVTGRIHYEKTLWKPVLASLAMGLFLAYSINQATNIFVSIIISSFIFLTTWFLSAIIESGGWLQLWKRYQIR